MVQRHGISDLYISWNLKKKKLMDCRDVLMSYLFTWQNKLHLSLPSLIFSKSMKAIISEKGAGLSKNEQAILLCAYA